MSEWVLGVSRSRSAPHVVTEIDAATRALFARNAWNDPFADRVAFADLRGRQTSWTGDRLEFLGRNASLDHPASLERGAELSGKTGAGLDPCAALQTRVELEPGERTEVVLLLGQGRDAAEARSLVERYRASSCDASLREVAGALGSGARRRAGRDARSRDERPAQPLAPLSDPLVPRLGALRVLPGRRGLRLPRPAPGRPGAGGDEAGRSCASTSCGPRPGSSARGTSSTGGIRRRAAASGRGSPTIGSGCRMRWSTTCGPRTIGRCSTKRVAWLDGPALEEGEQEAYFEPTESEDRATLYEHCARALDRSLAVGSHGLPLMGAGDWNDGMNRVGREGRGESVWLGWFLHVNLTEFARIAELRGEAERADALAEPGRFSRDVPGRGGMGRGVVQARVLRRRDAARIGGERRMPDRLHRPVVGRALRRGRRASGHARPWRRWMQRLVRRDDRLVLLFSPPFDRTALDPGYIKGYVPGIRENGGQYTHAAVWSIVALAMLGEGDKAVRALRPAEPHPACEPPREPASLQGRAVRRRRGRLLGAAARRARRLDLVHRGRGLALPRGPRVDPRASARRAPRSASIPAFPGGGSASRSATATAAASIGSASRIRRGSAGESPASSSTERRSRETRSSPSATTASSTGSR